MKPEAPDKSPYEAIVQALRDSVKTAWSRRWLPKEFKVRLDEESFRYLLANSVHGVTKEKFPAGTTALAFSIDDYQVVVTRPDKLIKSLENVLDKH